MPHAIHCHVRILVGAAALLAWVSVAGAVCPPSCPITGGGPEDQDCHAEFVATTFRLNYPPFNPAAPEPAREARCFDGDVGCDADGAVDRVCTFAVDVCLRNADPELPSCVPQDVTVVEVAGASEDPDLGALQQALDALLPATSNVCTSGQRLRVPLHRVESTGTYERANKVIELTLRLEDDSTATDRLEVACVPRGWPSHGYDHANHRYNPLETRLGVDNAGDLELKWRFDVGTASTATPTVGNGLVYAGAWNGDVMALDPRNGVLVWTFNAGGIVTSTPTLTADGRLLAVGNTNVVCLDALSGELLWSRDIRAREADHVWSSPQIANGRVFVGVASLSDNPCVQGRLVALDLEDGEVISALKTVPDRVCTDDTAVECTTDDDCNGGACVEGRSGGVTATVAVDPTGEIVYMNTVGCFTDPSLGDCDSVFRIDAASGDVIWKNRVQPPEQFGYCPDAESAECGLCGNPRIPDGGMQCSEDECGAGMCVKKTVYHDFGFLNGPILAEVDDGQGGTRTLVISGSKDGTLYALDPETGDEVWTNPVRPTPVTPGFAAFGLFNAALGFADQRLYAALDGAVFRPRLEDHLYAFDATDGSVVWTDEIGASWGSMALANGLAFMGTGTFGPVMRCENDETVSCASPDDCGGEPCVRRGPYYAYDAQQGERLREFVLPATVTSGASIVDGNVYVGYGALGGGGGVVALALPVCLGDCNADGEVRIDEVTRGVGINLGRTAYDTCPRFDGDDDGEVAVNELVGGVGNALQGCG